MVNYEKLLQESNKIDHFIESLKSKSVEVLLAKKSEKKWSAIEVVQHLNLVYDVYLDNFKKTVESAPDQTHEDSPPLQRTILGRMSIYSMKPKGKKRKFKMKTFDFFVPTIDEEKVEQVFSTFQSNKMRFNELIKLARKKNLKGVKIPTALGQKVKFYIPECMEFILAHEQRHIVQIKGLLG